MPTPAEQKALLFLGAVALVGGAVRLFGGDAPVPEPTPHERAGLTAQIAMTESATAAARAERAGKRSRKKPRSRGRAEAAQSPTPDAQPPAPLDVDRASAEELDRLPGVGPALAARIVADREVNGAFGSLAALDAVSGVGPTLIKRLAPHVTFSGPRRPSTAIGSGGGARVSGRVVGLIGGRP